MKTSHLSFSLIWGFVISQMTSLVLVLSFFVLADILWVPNTRLVWGIAFLIGLIAFIGLRKRFEKLSLIVGVVTLVLFFLCVLGIPLLGRMWGDKAEQMQSK